MVQKIFGELDKPFQWPFRGGAVVGAGSDGDDEILRSRRSGGRGEIGGVEWFGSEFLNKKEVVVDLMLDGAGFADDLNRICEEFFKFSSRVAEPLMNACPGKSLGRGAAFPGDGGVEGNFGIFKETGDLPGRIGSVVFDDEVDFRDLAPDGRCVLIGDDDDGAPGAGCPESAHGGDTKTCFQDRFRRSDGEIASIQMEWRAIWDGSSLWHLGHERRLAMIGVNVTRERLL